MMSSILKQLSMFFQRRILPLALVAGVGILLSGCGGGVAGGVGESGTGIVNVGVLTGQSDGSLTVNGVTYDRSGAATLNGFGNTVAAEQVQLGMWVEVQADREGVATSIRIQPAARGVITAKDSVNQTITLLNSVVHYGSSTILAGVSDGASLSVGDLVEVHGALSHEIGKVEASRIARLAEAPSAQNPFELRGRISNLDTATRTLTMEGQQISYANATVAMRGSLVNGMMMRVASAAAPAPNQAWAVERLVQDQPLPDKLSFMYAEGIVSDWVAGPMFKLEGLSVDATRTNQRATVTGNGQRVAVFGPLVAGTLEAKAVSVVEPDMPTLFILAGNVTDFQSLSSFRLRGVLVDAGAAQFSRGTATDVAEGARLRVKGRISGRRIIAFDVEVLS